MTKMRKYQVFVSSTFLDLQDERKSVTWEILKAGHIPVGMESFSAYDDRGWKVINRTLETTDYYVLILAGRYGSIDDSLGMSWTEREYRRAVELGIPVLAFVREKRFVSGDHVDTDERAKKLVDLIADVASKRLREMWTTPDDLRAKVGLALLKAVAEDESEGNPRPGWYRGTQLPPAHTRTEGVAELVAKLFLTTMSETMYANLEKLVASDGFGSYEMSKGLERELYHLRDIGYVQVKSIGAIPKSGRNLSDHVQATDAGREFVRVRQTLRR